MKKLLLLGMVAVLLSFALVMVSCGDKCIGDGDCGIKADGSNYKWCGTNVTDTDDAKKALECGAYKNLLTGKEASCDCG
jgi:hypothetical protein